MPLYITIAAAATVAITAKLMYLVFLSGRTITNATLFGRLVAGIEPARRAFVQGWRTRSWGYLCIVWPCMLLSMGLVSLLLKWMMPGLESAQSLSDKIRYCLLVFGVGMPASIAFSLVLVLAVYYIRSLIGAWWNSEPEAPGDATTPPPGEAETSEEGSRPPGAAPETE